MVINYLLVVTWFAGCVAIQEKYFEKCSPHCCRKNRGDSSPLTGTANFTTRPSALRCMSCYGTLLINTKWLVLALTFLGTAYLSVFQVPNLEAPKELPQLLPLDSNFERLMGIRILFACSDCYHGTNDNFQRDPISCSVDICGTDSIAGMCAGYPNVDYISHMLSGDCFNELPGTTCLLACSQGYSGIGDMSLSCNAGVYSVIIGECRADCPGLSQSPIPLTEVGSCGANVVSGGACELQCSSGSIANNSLVTLCIDGDFVFPSVTCEGIINLIIFPVTLMLNFD